MKADNIEKHESWKMIIKKLITCQNTHEKNDLINKLTQTKRPRILSFINAHAANLIWTDFHYRKKILASDFLLRDGSGIHLWLSLLKKPSGLNLNGTDFIPEILDSYDTKTVIAVYGTEGMFLKDGIAAIKSMGFQSIFSENGFHSPEYYIEKYKQQKPGLVILAMGMPKQEILSISLREASDPGQNVLIINGGGIIDFLSGRVKRAPEFMRRMGIEWLHRLACNPRKLWKRNLGSVVFILRALKFKRTYRKM